MGKGTSRAEAPVAKVTASRLHSAGAGASEMATATIWST